MESSLGLRRFLPGFLRGRGGNGVAGNGGETKGLPFPGQGQWQFWPGSDIQTLDMVTGVNEVGQSSVVGACLNWLMRTFPEAPVVVERRNAQQWEVIESHDLEELLDQPNPYYDGRVLWMATIMDFSFGEAYWLKLRNAFGKVVQLWWVPRGFMTPRWYPTGPFIDHYDYRPGAGPPIELDPRDVVHFRFGMDPANIRRGLSQLGCIVREVYTDDQANRFTAALLKNLGVIGVIVAPKQGAASPTDVADLKAYLATRFTGDHRGDTLVMSRPTDVNVMQYNLQGFDVGPIRDISEERVCAALGLPAAVIGFGTGLQQTKVGATMREMIQLAWRGAIMPSQKIIAGELKRSLLPDFQSNLGLFRVRFDASQVQALWEDDAQKSERIVRALDGGAIMLSEARRDLGYPSDASQEVYYRPGNVMPVPKADVAKPPPAPAPKAPPGGEGAPLPFPKGVKGWVTINGNHVFIEEGGPPARGRSQPAPWEPTIREELPQGSLGDAALKEFGETDYLPNAGYITTDGRLVDFSEGGGSGRSLDHRAVERIFATEPPSRWDAVQAMMDDGQMRVHYGGLGRGPGDELNVDLAVEPTGAQVRLIQRAIREYQLDGLLLERTIDGEVMNSVELRPAAADEVPDAIARVMRNTAADRQRARVRAHGKGRWVTIDGNHVYLAEASGDVGGRLSAWEMEHRSDPVESALVLDRHGEVIANKQGEVDHVEFSDAEMSQINQATLNNHPVTFSHNHPMDRLLSGDDLAFATRLRLAEMRAVGPHTTYIMRIPEDQRGRWGPNMAGQIWNDEVIKLGDEWRGHHGPFAPGGPHADLVGSWTTGSAGPDEPTAHALDHIAMQRIAKRLGWHYERQHTT